MHEIFGEDSPRSLWWLQQSSRRAPSVRGRVWWVSSSFRPVSVIVYNPAAGPQRICGGKGREGELVSEIPNMSE